ncbi:uroporphyrinogen decarboxylase family protein [Desulfuromonas thiophila]|uniref:Uroporphyrinogen decarboxylase n=1 Tax=Desulfuromonas thiophila TaxID=57664 RepID=A0A1G6WXT5_9BACT|nr:uroporphyrinogen decarboxylase family protein [Desulfuromonas thiophila]SDD69805.1 uroporphyrinogen decarboxylase [Desulfuromonas thiophila]
MNKDQMTPMERFAAYAKGESIDRLPCVPVVGNGAARALGCKISEFRGNGPLIAAAHLAAYRRFGYDTVRIFTDLYVLAEAMGATVCYPRDETAHLETPAIADIADIGRLRPANPWRDGNLPALLQALEIAQKEVGHQVPVSGAVVCPLTTASFLIGTDKLIRMMRRDPEGVHRLCEIALESALNYAEAVLDTGSTFGLTEPVSSNTIISPAYFEEFSYPYLKRLCEFMHGRGKPVTLHICGKTERIWPLMADAGADCISIDEMEDLRKAKESVGHRVRVMGNVATAETLLQGSVADVRAETLDCIRKAYDNPKGFIVASGCSLPTEVPFANIDAMLDMTREVGWPITADKLAAMT